MTNYELAEFSYKMKNPVVAYIFLFLTGWIGLHRLYLEDYTNAAIIFLTTCLSIIFFLFETPVLTLAATSLIFLYLLNDFLTLDIQTYKYNQALLLKYEQ